MKGRILLAVLLAFFCLAHADAQPVKVEKIKSYVIEVDVRDSVHVKNIITLRNLINKPLVPGIGEFRIQKSSPIKIGIISIPFTEKRSAVRVENVKAYTLDGKKLNVRVEEKENYTVIYYEIWYPVEPNSQMTFVIEFDSPDLVEKGILFKETSIPVGADVDIEHLEVRFSSDWNLVYVKNTNATLPAGTLSFSSAEFSVIPLPMIGIKWSTTFWSIVLTIVIMSAIYFRKRPKNVSET
jgi:hypothetical protein